MNCLKCGLPLKSTDSGEWHRKCIRPFFGTSQLPSLDLTLARIQDWAEQTVQAGIVVAGVQKKMSLHLDRNPRPSRFTMLDFPFGYLLKPPSAEFDSLPEYEHALLLLAQKARIPTVPFGLLRLASGELAFITRRIDRESDQKIPMEDFCQLSERMTEDKYRSSCEQCGKLIRKFSARPGVDSVDFFIRILFCFVTGNSDMHLKNFSLFQQNDSWVLSPAYDLVPTNLIIPDDLEESALTINGKRSKLQLSDFFALAKALEIPEKVTRSVIHRFLATAEDFTQTLDRSFLGNQQREQLKNLIETRISRIGKPI